jgi:hypothetical protein
VGGADDNGMARSPAGPPKTVDTLAGVALLLVAAFLVAVAVLVAAG